MVDTSAIKPSCEYSIREAAALLDIHRNTLAEWTKRGLIKVKENRKTLRKSYLGSELLKFLR